MTISNKLKKTAFRLALLLAGAGTAAGVAAAQVYVRVGPPRPVFERRPPMRPGYVWQPGYHRWDGHHYVWVPGTYVVAPRPGAVWVAGRWRHSHRGYIWEDGRWR